MRSLYYKSPPSAVIPPKGIRTAVIDPKTGYLATSACPQTFREAYLKGTAPEKTCPEHPVNPAANKTSKKMRDPQ
jgi:penicillin-binding protein 2D